MPERSELFDSSKISVVLLDIEGTTTPITFVTQVLFPYARAHVADFLRGNAQRAEVKADLDLLRREHAAERAADGSVPPWTPEAEIDSAVSFVHWLIDRDRKSPALKSLQGRIWEEGYRSGRLRGEVYPDVAPAFARWRAQQRDIAIFSSGSVLAQKLLFAHSTAGDLTEHIRAYFDLSAGPKHQQESYRKIAESLNLPAGATLFLSDAPAEIAAARSAGMHAALCVRGDAQPVAAERFVVRTFDEIR